MNVPSRPVSLPDTGLVGSHAQSVVICLEQMHFVLIIFSCSPAITRRTGKTNCVPEHIVSPSATFGALAFAGLASLVPESRTLRDVLSSVVIFGLRAGAACRQRHRVWSPRANVNRPSLSAADDVAVESR